MIYLVGEMSNGSQKLQDTLPRGIGRCYVERPMRPFPGEPWFLDNGVFRAWNAAGRDCSIDYADCYRYFEGRLPEVGELTRQGVRPMFVVVPDRPGDAASLWESLAWLDWYEETLQADVDPAGWALGCRQVPLYLAVQDGLTPQELGDLPLCSETERHALTRVDGLFLGGTDDFKLDIAGWRALCDWWGLALHFGRCTQSRIEGAVEAGCDSADSSHPNRLTGARWQRFLQVHDEILIERFTEPQGGHPS